MKSRRKLRFYNLQSISGFQILFKISFVLEKGLLPKNPLWAEKGEGWADSMMKCFLVSISIFLLLAKLHQRIKITQEVCLDIACMIWSVKVSQPIFQWLAGSQAFTVKIALRSNTHSQHHFSKFPPFGISIHRSSWSSL